jgi:hypothetical protein
LWNALEDGWKTAHKGAIRNVVLVLFGQVKKKNYYLFFNIFLIYILAKKTRVLKVLQNIFWGKMGPSYDIMRKKHMKSHIQTSYHFMHEELQIFLCPSFISHQIWWSCYGDCQPTYSIPMAFR